MAKKRKTERDELSEACKTLTKLLLFEASGGIIPLPKGVEKYAPPPIPFTERRAFLDSVAKGLLIDLKINPESEESEFDKMKGELNGGKRDSEASSRRRAKAARDAAIDELANEPDESDFLTS